MSAENYLIQKSEIAARLSIMLSKYKMLIFSLFVVITLDLNELLQIVYFDIELLRGLLEEVLRAGQEVPVHFT